MLVNSRELFKTAQREHFAIPGANFVDMESIKFHVGTAQELQLPLILEVAESHLGDNISLEDAALVGRKYAEDARIAVRNVRRGGICAGGAASRPRGEL